MSLRALTLALLLAPLPATAQQEPAASPLRDRTASVLGEAELEGGRVEILSNGTWRRVGEFSPRSCAVLAAEFAFCGLDRGWSQVYAPPGFGAAVFLHADVPARATFVLNALPEGQTITPAALEAELLRRAEAAYPGRMVHHGTYPLTWGEETGFTLAVATDGPEGPQMRLQSVVFFARHVLEITTRLDGIDGPDALLLDLHQQVVDLARPGDL